MVFRYTYRGADGAVRTGVVEAASRGDAFDRLRGRGIAPVSMAEGDGRPRSGQGGWGAPRLKAVGIVLAAAIAMAAAVSILILSMPRTGRPERPTPNGAATGKPADTRGEEAGDARPSREKGEGKEVEAPGIPAPRIEARAEAPIPGALETEGEKARGRKPQRIFRRGVEQLLALATPSAPGAPVPPLPHITNESVAEDLGAAMREAILPSPDDTERTLEMKLSVSEQKEEFRDLSGSGMSFTEYLAALREKFNQDHEFMAEAHRLAEALGHDAAVSDEEYRACRKMLNERLRERGLPELD